MPKRVVGVGLASLVVAVVGAAALSSYGGNGPAIQVRLTVTSYLRGDETTKRFSLGCVPLSGSLQLRASVCRDIAEHRQAMLSPRPERSTCLGSPFAPVVQVEVVKGARKSSFSGMPECGWPGGTPLAIYWDASRNDAVALRRDSARLRCEDNPTFFAEPPPFASIVACTRGLWTPAAERAIRSAEAAPQLALLRPHALFPADPGAVRCRIPAGGPTRRVFSGLCGVSLTGPPSSKLVHFVEAWTQGEHVFRHRWALRGSTLISEHGTVPPQLWR